MYSVGFKLTRKEAEVAVPQEKMFKLKDVMEAIVKQVQGQVVLLFKGNLPDAYFSKLRSRFVFENCQAQPSPSSSSAGWLR